MRGQVRKDTASSGEVTSGKGEMGIKKIECIVIYMNNIHYIHLYEMRI